MLREFLVMAASTILFGALGQAQAEAPRFRDLAALREIVIVEMRKRPAIIRATPDEADPSKINVETATAIGVSDITNLHGYLRAYPDEDMEAIIARYIDAAVANDTPSAANLVAVVRTRDAVEHAAASGTRMIYEPLERELVVQYMADLPNSLESVTREDFPDTSIEELRGIAISNLGAWLERVVVEDFGTTGRMYTIEGNPQITSGLLLLDDFRRTVRSIFPDDILVAIPRKDQIFVFDATDPQAKVLAGKIIEATFADDYNLLSDRLYIMRGEKLELLPR